MSTIKNTGKCNCASESTEMKYQRLGLIIDEMKGKKDNLVQVLHIAQEIFGYLPKELQEFISKKMDMPLSTVFGVITFYSYFSTKPKGKNVIKICLGTACYVKGAQKLVDRVSELLDLPVGGITKECEFSLEVMRCVGACGLAPVMLINDDVYGNVNPEDIDGIIAKYSTQKEEICGEASL
jgi:NADH:ubiquinone oxidoreductase subunit E